MEGTDSDQNQALPTLSKADETSTDPKAGSTSVVPSSGANESADPTTHLSKKQRKRLLKRDMLQEKKRQRKEDRRAKAIAQGRDVEAEQKLQAERTALGHRKQRIENLWQNKIKPLAQQSFQIAIDCSFESLMTQREIGSLAQQLKYCYSYNKRAENPCYVAATSLREGSSTLSLLQRDAGFPEWSNRLFVCTDQSLEDYYSKDRSRLVYLTSDSEHTLDRLEDDKIYVIGGIVDRNRLKRVAMDRANTLGVATAKFPLDVHLAKMSSTPVLACNHVFDILIKCRQYNNDWAKALEEVLPSRKEAVFQTALPSSEKEASTASEPSTTDTPSEKGDTGICFDLTN